MRERPHDRIAAQAERAERPYLSRLGHWAYHAPNDWLLSRSCFPATAVVAGFAIAGLFVTVPFATPLLVANWAIPIGVVAMRAASQRRWSFFARPQAHQVSCVGASPKTPVEIAYGQGGGHQAHSHNAGGFRRALRHRAARGGRLATALDDSLARPSRVIMALGKLTLRAEQGNRVAAIIDDWLNERSQLYSLAAEAVILGVGLGLGAPWALVFSMQMLFHNVPDLLSLYVGLRTGERHRVFRPGMYQRRTTVESLRVRSPLQAPAPERAAPAISSHPPRGAERRVRALTFDGLG